MPLKNRNSKKYEYQSSHKERAEEESKNREEEKVEPGALADEEEGATADQEGLSTDLVELQGDLFLPAGVEKPPQCVKHTRTHTRKLNQAPNKNNIIKGLAEVGLFGPTTR